MRKVAIVAAYAALALATHWVTIRAMAQHNGDWGPLPPPPPSSTALLCQLGSVDVQSQYTIQHNGQIDLEFIFVVRCGRAVGGSCEYTVGMGVLDYNPITGVYERNDDSIYCSTGTRLCGTEGLVSITQTDVDMVGPSKIVAAWVSPNQQCSPMEAHAFQYVFVGW